MANMSELLPVLFCIAYLLRYLYRLVELLLSPKMEVELLLSPKMETISFTFTILSAMSRGSRVAGDAELDKRELAATFYGTARRKYVPTCSSMSHNFLFIFHHKICILMHVCLYKIL